MKHQGLQEFLRPRSPERGAADSHQGCDWLQEEELLQKPDESLKLPPSVSLQAAGGRRRTSWAVPEF